MKLCSVIIQLLSSIFSCFYQQTYLRPIVTINNGTLQGTVERLIEDSMYYSFKGVPYAEAPTGDHRFEGPLQAQAWHGVRDAADHGPICFQPDETNTTRSEQCLFLNIYTRSLDPASKQPVMVFIHGDSYYFGSGNADKYSPELLLQHDVVLVTINYRLGGFGFLAVGTREVPGNAGMRDQVMALRWIKENIKQFGGDPDNVTIFGESAGASSVTYLVLSPMAKGLFHKAIAQSGVCLQAWAQDRDMKNRAIRAAKGLGKDTNNIDEVLDFLRSLPAANLTSLSDLSMTSEESKQDLTHRFVPVVEPQFPDIQPFLDEDPASMLVQKKANRVPLLLGYNSGEGITIMFSDIGKLKSRIADASYFVPSKIADKLPKEILTKFGSRIYEFYSNFSNEHLDKIRDFSTDVFFAYNVHRFAYLYDRVQSPVYMYKFNFDTDLNIAKQSVDKYKHLEGAAHGDDLYYLFYNKYNRDIFDKHPKLRRYAYEVTKLWTNFAKTGNPTPDDSFGIRWLPYTAAGKEYFLIQQNYTMGSYADQDRMEFWNEMYKEAGLQYILQ